MSNEGLRSQPSRPSPEGDEPRLYQAAGSNLLARLRVRFCRHTGPHHFEYFVTDCTCNPLYPGIGHEDTCSRTEMWLSQCLTCGKIR